VIHAPSCRVDKAESSSATNSTLVRPAGRPDQPTHQTAHRTQSSPPPSGPAVIAPPAPFWWLQMASPWQRENVRAQARGAPCADPDRGAKTPGRGGRKQWGPLHARIPNFPASRNPPCEPCTS
jgi:hypothetical protein